ncbi:hypothetical protein [Candidatus Nitrotoga arctica]|uniref:Uncharacterized protein n=1 Tax=Candidatus Nitrotoga arctica TaxID=453162 RepID=A0ABM8Z2C1_9PROT|nr:hypothetical protein [Candidatus Nitrotoga arctica]CAG9934001.1 conserved protein of unknown function [Candidatus Nitrotoga arctica]
MLKKDIHCFTLAQDLALRPLSTQLIADLHCPDSPRWTQTINASKRFVAICLGLMAALGATADTFAQALPSSPSLVDTDYPTVVTKVSSSINWDTIRWVERRYKIEAMRFKARDETGIDWLGSDEVMVETTDAKGWTVSNEIGDIDTGDTHNFDPAKSCIVGVPPGIVVLGESSVCEKGGEPGPLSFQVEFWEKDTSPFGGFCIPAAGEHVGPYCVDDTYGDDFIGSAQIDYLTQELEAALPNVGDEQIESVRLDSCPGQICGDGGGPWNLGDYTFTWRVTRLPNALVNLGSLLTEAMQRSGARSELEVITAGLRYLRAPIERKTKPEIDKLPPKR